MILKVVEVTLLNVRQRRPTEAAKNLTQCSGMIRRWSSETWIQYCILGWRFCVFIRRQRRQSGLKSGGKSWILIQKSFHKIRLFS